MAKCIHACEVTVSTERIVRTYMTLIGTYTLAASLIWSVNTLFLLDAGLNIAEVFVANAAFSVGMVIFEIPTGVVADTLGRRTSYLISVVILGVTTVLYLIAAELQASLPTFVAVSVFMGLGFTFYSGALEAWLVDALQSVDSDRPLDGVFARGQQVSGVAMFTGTIAGGFLGQLDLAVPFAARAILLVIVFGIASRLMHDMGFARSRLELRTIGTQMRRQASVGVSHGWNERSLRLLMISGGLRGVFFGWAFYAAQPYFLELLDRDAVWIVGLITAGVSLATIAGNQLVGVFSKRCAKRTTLLLWGASAGTLAAITIGLTSSFAVALVALFTVAASMGVMSPVRQAFLHELVDSDSRATVLSFDAMVTSIGGAGGQLGLGRVADASSLSTGYIVGGATTGLALPVLWLLRGRSSGADDIEKPDRDAGVDSSCPAGLPSIAGVHPVAVDAVST